MGLHDLRLQRLESKLRNNNRLVTYPVDVFSHVSYDSKPLIFWRGKGKPNHPDFDSVKLNQLPPEYEVVGNVQDTHVRILNGVPYQYAIGNVTNETLDSEMRANPSEYSLSTAFMGTVSGSGDDSRISDVPETNHVLLFKMDAETLPNDLASEICNTPNAANPPIANVPVDGGVILIPTPITVEKNMTNETKKETKETAPITNMPEPVEDSQGVNPQARLEAAEADRDKLMALVAQLYQMLTGGAQMGNPMGGMPPMEAMTNLKTEVENLRKRNDDYEWGSIQANLPEDMRGEAHKSEYLSDKQGFMLRALGAPRPITNTPDSKKTPSIPSVRERVPLPANATVDDGYEEVPNVSVLNFNDEAEQKVTIPVGNAMGNDIWMGEAGLKIDGYALIHKRSRPARAE